MALKLSLIAAHARNGVIGNGPDIPWHAKGEQLLFKAMTYNQWLLVGRKTFESMGLLPNRKYAVVSRSGLVAAGEGVLVFNSIEQALTGLGEYTDHAMVAGGGEIYASLIDRAQTLHLSVVDTDVDGDVHFPDVPVSFEQVFEQRFESNINYRYQIWQRR